MQGCRGGVVPFHDDGEALHMWVTKELVVTPAFSTLESNTDSCTSAELLGKVARTFEGTSVHQGTLLTFIATFQMCLESDNFSLPPS